MLEKGHLFESKGKCQLGTLAHCIYCSPPTPTPHTHSILPCIICALYFIYFLNSLPPSSAGGWVQSCVLFSFCLPARHMCAGYSWNCLLTHGVTLLLVLDSSERQMAQLHSTVYVDQAAVIPSPHCRGTPVSHVGAMGE